MSQVGFVYIYIPSNKDEHIYNLAIISQAVSKVSRGIYFILKGDAKNTTVELIAQYYGEIASSSCNLKRRSFIVLPFDQDLLPDYINYLSETTDQNHPSEYILLEHNNQFPSEFGLKKVPLTISPEQMEEASKIEKEHYAFKPIDNNKRNTYGKFKNVCMGGTFDHVHLGHYLCFSQIAMIFNGKGSIIVGISDGDLLKDKTDKELLQSFDKRKVNFEHCMIQIHPQILLPSKKHKTEYTFDIMQLFEPYGPTVTYEDIEALVVSEETEKGGHSVNKKRVEKGMKEVELFVAPVIRPRGSNCKLSSSQIRQELSKK
ncbi:nucleotidyl transferase [Acrasis kona]|uniref:Nucleotidyl transferase n=1 Tax=Acrasis kona TaxID=1008807 RepID=A0AAW2YJL2_9EUKA